MTALAAVVATVVSLAALAYLAATDPKRRRVFGVDPLEDRRHVVPALAVLFLPGVVLLGYGNGAGFVIWLGALSVAGWGLAALTPAQATRLRGWSTRLVASGTQPLALSMRQLPSAAASLARWIGATGGMPDRITILERRVAALEAELAAVREAHDRSHPMPAPGENDDVPSLGATDASKKRRAHRWRPESVR